MTETFLLRLLRATRQGTSRRAILVNCAKKNVSRQMQGRASMSTWALPPDLREVSEFMWRRYSLRSSSPSVVPSA